MTLLGGTILADHLKALIIDDTKISRAILKKMISKVGKSEAAANGNSAIELYEAALGSPEPFDLITLDVQMPDMDGVDVLKTIRTLEKKKDIAKTDRVKIIMITAKMNLSVIKQCIKLGCDKYLTKPVDRIQFYRILVELGFNLPDELIDKKVKSKNEIVGEIIQRFYAGKIDLPVLPHIVKEVQSHLDGKDPSIEGLAKIVEKDPVISGKLIQVANSALYKGVDTVDHLHAALLRLGLKAAQAAISTLVNKYMFKSEHPVLKQLLEKLWLHSLACACSAKLIADRLKLPNS